METKTDDPEVSDHNEGSQDNCEDIAVVDSSGSIGGSTCVRLNKVLIYFFFNLRFFIWNFLSQILIRSFIFENLLFLQEFVEVSSIQSSLSLTTSVLERKKQSRNKYTSSDDI